MSTGIGCTVYVDGVRIADGRPGDDADHPDDPTALSGLSVSWGRATTVDQPDTSTCELDVLDAPGGTSFVEVLRIGRRIDVDADGVLFPDPTLSTFLDPGFEAGTVPPSVRVGTAARSRRRANTGGWSMRVDPGPDATRTVTVLLPPAPFQTRPNAPDAWDGIPATAAGQRWTVAAAVNAPPLVEVEVAVVAFAGPYPDAGEVLAAGEIVDQGADIGFTPPWVQLGPFDVTPPPGRWLGLHVATRNRNRWADQPPTLTWADVDPTWQWGDYGAVYVDDVEVLAPAGGAPQTVRVFSGRITDLEAGWDTEADAPVVNVTAADFTSELANRNVGDEPWLVEPLGDRFARVIDLSGMTVDVDLPEHLAAVPLSWQDVDSQPAAGLLRDFTQSVDGILWSATHRVTGPYLRVEDPTQRPGLYLLALVAGVVVIVDNADADALDLSACDLLRDPARFVQDVSDVTTRVAVTWLEQGVDDEGRVATTERTLTVVDEQLEVDYGVRRLSLTTLLQSPDDAEAVADAILARTSVTDWRATDLTVVDEHLDTAGPDAVMLLLTLLSGTARLGLPLKVVDLPSWSPVPRAGVFLEGGRYEFVDGGWQLALTVSRGANQGGSLPWSQLDPAWRWRQFDPAMQWQDLAGVAGITTPTAA